MNSELTTILQYFHINCIDIQAVSENNHPKKQKY